jgi:hypothetical protein
VFREVLVREDRLVNSGQVGEAAFQVIASKGLRPGFEDDSTTGSALSRIAADVLV